MERELSAASLIALKRWMLVDWQSGCEFLLPLSCVPSPDHSYNNAGRPLPGPLPPAGASLVEVYSAFAYEGPRLVPRIKRELAACLARDGFASVAEAVGADHRAAGGKKA